MGIMNNPKTFSKEDVAELESRLESQYVPFYLHDLRTNEILNFHAFVENVSDSYSANWNDSDGYGRMDPVQTYKNTTRSISVDFYVVSTSEKDFDRVWWTINRLVMMVYPQWSEGSKISGEGYDFVQPFSQVITSSPIVRLRVGDLIASNYSRLNLARSFGVGSVGMFISGSSNTYDPLADTKNIGYLDKFQQFVNELSNNPSRFSVASPIDPMLATPGGPQNLPVVFASNTIVEQGIGFLLLVAGMNGSITVPKGAMGKVRDGKAKSDGSVVVLVELDNPIKVRNLASSIAGNRSEVKFVLVHADRLYSNSFLKEENVPSSRTSSQIYNDLEDSYKRSDLLMKQINDANNAGEDNTALREMLRVENRRVDALRTEQDAAIMRESEQFRADAPRLNAELNVRNEFSSPSEYFATSRDNKGGNSIIRSFEDAGGRGLAGSIRSLSFDWNEAPWETSAGSRAPIWCKVSMQFNPIHDIPMGLDHEGMPRSVPYPVGETVRQTFFPELHEQSKKEKVQQTVDDKKFGSILLDEAEEVVNGYIGRSLKRIF
jgi:hypothetical protein